jgi:hypothetical protein
MATATLPELPEIALVWDGAILRAALRDAGLKDAAVGLVFGKHTSTIGKWALPRGHQNAIEPSLDHATDLAFLVFGDQRRVLDFFVYVERETGAPVEVLPGTT